MVGDSKCGYGAGVLIQKCEMDGNIMRYQDDAGNQLHRYIWDQIIMMMAEENASLMDADNNNGPVATLPGLRPVRMTDRSVVLSSGHDPHCGSWRWVWPIQDPPVRLLRLLPPRDNFRPRTMKGMKAHVRLLAVTEVRGQICSLQEQFGAKGEQLCTKDGLARPKSCVFFLELVAWTSRQ